MLRRRASVPLLWAAAFLVGALAPATPAGAQVRADWFAAPGDSAASSAEVFLGYFRYPVQEPGLYGSRLSADRLLLRSSDLSGRWWQDLDHALAASRDSLWSTHPTPAGTGVAPGKSGRGVNPLSEMAAADSTGGPGLPGAMGQYADLGLLVNGRGEMGGAWQRFEPCDVLSVATCDQGLTPRLRPDLNFGVLLGGTITDRIHVAVDYDQTREFDAANNINVYYEGLEDEILQRFEMGDVSIVMPQSQFLTGGIPGGNFGFRALAQVGPLELQSVWAQQQGDIGSLDLNIDGRTGRLYEENSITIDDHAYAAGRFFFLIDPTQLPGYPHIDVLTLEQDDAPEVIRPNVGTLQFYRDEDLSPVQQQQSRVFPGHAIPPGGASEFTISGNFSELGPSDYVVHRSGLWIMLRQPLGPYETLAMSYVTMSGDTIGTINAAATQATSFEDAPELRLLRGPAADHHPEAPTWEYEMHHVYQVFSGELAPEDLDLEVRLGDALQGQPFLTYSGQQVALLRLFGLDEGAPMDRLDPERVFLPSEYQTGTATVTGTYVAFPTLRPFADPPPTSQLDTAQAAAALGDNANRRMYDERDPDLRANTRFRMVASYRVRTDGLISEFSLGSFGVREGSERIMLDGVPLRAGTDYTVDYSTGMVRLSNPQQLFAGRQSPRITADFERSSTFDIAPKSIFGTTARWRLGQAGDVNLVGFYQTQRSVMSRPELGNEPNSIMMGGMTTNLRFGAGWLDRALDAIPALRLAGESSLGLSGEVAMSLPNPNTRGVAYLDDFEATSDVPIPMSQLGWRLGSRPGSSAGAAGYLPLSLDPTSIAGIVWQHQAYAGGGGMYGAVRAEVIDTTIATVGRELPEGVLYLTLSDNPLAQPDDRIWRSLTTVLSTRGADLTTSEYLEFYAGSTTDGLALVLDLGTVSEDAYFIDSTYADHGTHGVTGQPWGIGVLDREAGYDQPWGIDLDHGLWNQGCEAEPGMVYLLGSPLANCTVNNGLNDSEDLNGDGVPNLDDGALHRYVVPLGPSSPYLARDRHETGSNFRLYRIPLRGADALALNGATEQSWRSVRHLRMTLTADNCGGAEGCAPDQVLALARMRISGSTWKKRETVGVIAGLVGSEVVPGDHQRSVRLGPVSAVTDGSAYLGPPGAVDQASDPSQQYGAGGAEVNEKGLRIAALDLEPGARAEVFHRFASETRSFMEYQELRLWALPRAGEWGEGGTVSLLVKIGTDRDNYYLYRTPLRPPIEHRDIDSRAYWLPEVVIDFEPWFELKARAEAAALIDGDSARVVWNEDSTHAIVLSSRAQAPNLAAIRELSLAIHNDDGLPLDSAEVWVNDLRLGDGRSEVDFASFVSLNAVAADFATFRLSLANSGARFQPMNRDATLESARDVGLSGRFELGHFAPSGWGLSLPVTVQHTRNGNTPEFLQRTDIRADELEGLRESDASNTQVGVSVSKTTPSPNRWMGLLVDGARLNLNWQSTEQARFTSRNTVSNFNGGLSWDHQLQPRTLDITPDFLVGALRWLAPLAIEQSEFFRRLSSADLRWSPSDLSFSTSYRDQDSENYSYAGVLKSPADSAVIPIRSPQRDLENGITIGFRPVESLTARLGVSSQRDLLGGAELQTNRFGEEAVADVRRDLAGVDLGWERSNALAGSLQFQPRIASWLRPTMSWTSNYRGSRTPSYLDYDTMRVGESIDTLSGHMLRDFNVDSRLERRLHFDPAGLVRATWGQEPAPDLGFVPRMFFRLGNALLPLELTLSDELGSTFQRNADAPGYGYRFGFGDMRALRFVAGDTAVTATERNGVMMRGGLRLPLNMQLDLTYEDRARNALTGQGASNVVRDLVWPDVRLGISSLPVPAALADVLLRASANAGYRVELSEHQFATSAPRDRDAVRVPIQVSLTFAPAISATYTATFGNSESREATGVRRGDEMLQTVQLRSTFDAPEFLQPNFVNPFTASLGYGYNATRACDVGRGLVLPGEEERCARSIDRMSRDMHFSLETRVNDLNVGAQFSLNEHQSFIGRRDGNREFRLSIFANFNLGIGVLPEGMGTGGMGY